MLRASAIALSLGRAALGVGLLLAPGRVASGWVGDAGERDDVAVLARSVGIRDIVIGGGAAIALLGERPAARGWLLAAAGADLGDLAGTLAARGALPDSGVRITAALAGGSAAVSLLAAARRS